MHKSKYIVNIIVAFLLTIIISCESDEVCTENIETYASISFVRLSTVDSLIQENTLSINNLIIFPLDRNYDSIYNYQNEVTDISLPLNPNIASTSFVIKADTIQDTLYFHHQSEMYFVSLECGFTWLFNLDETTHTTHLIDSIIVVDTIIDLNERNNYKIYFR